MSRSFKKYPCVKCEKSCKFGKRQSNKRIRNLSNDIYIPKGRYYQKFYNSSEVCDYKSVQFKEWEIQDWYKDQYDIINNVRPWKARYNKSLQETLNLWYTYYKTK